MKYFYTTVIAICVILLLGCSPDQERPAPAPESSRQLTQGTLVGFADRFDTWSWLGVPFTRPPVGELRWRAPQPPQPWAGTLQALDFSAMCPQLPIPMVNATREKYLGSEDCLYLNISAPRSWKPGDDALPVMVWLHGGGNSVGSADLYPALRNLAGQQQLVTVSIHYRLGILGWFRPPALVETAINTLDASGNFGTLDTIAALQWVRDNIQAFGGDADNVTLFGESAGGINTLALVLSPLAKGLFHRAISQSGLLMTTDPRMAENHVDDEPAGHGNNAAELLLRLLQADGLAPNRNAARTLAENWSAVQVMDYMRSKPPQQLLLEMQSSEMGLYFTPNLLRDGVVLPAGDPLEQLRNGHFNRVPIIMGTNRDEMKTMLTRHPDYINLRFGLLPRVIDQALFDRVSGYGSSMWKAVGADEPAQAMVEAGHEPVYVYRFDWDQVTPNWLIDFPSLLGAAHSFEIPFVFHDLDNEMSYLPFDFFDADSLPGARPLAAAMASLWGQFAHQGSPTAAASTATPAWLPWQDGGRYLRFNSTDNGGITLNSGAVSRNGVFTQMLEDTEKLGGREELCRAWQAQFAPEAIFGMTASCAKDQPCPGSKANFCP